MVKYNSLLKVTVAKAFDFVESSISLSEGLEKNMLN